MGIKLIKNLIYGISLLATSIFVLVYSTRFPDFIVRRQKLPGPRFFPAILAIIIIAAGIYVIASQLAKMVIRRRSSEPPQEVLEEDKMTRRGFLNVLAVVAGVFFYIIMVEITGFNLTTFAFSFLLMLMLNVRWWRAIIYSLVLVVAIVLIFGYGFRIPLPEGSLFWAI